MARKATPSTPAPAPASEPPAKAPAASAKSAAKRGAVAKSAQPAPAPAASPPPPKAAKAAVITVKQLAGQLAESHDMPAKQAQAVMDGVVGLLVEHLKAGDKLRLTGLGVLEVKDRPARMGRNPATGAAVQIAASKKIAFRPAKELKEAI